MKLQKFTSLLLTTCAIFATALPTFAEAKLKILLVNGGCCHDYPKQGPLLKSMIESSLDAEVTLALSTSNQPDARFAVYENDNWADGYDLVVHNECTARASDPVYIERILKAHREGLPAVNVHCAMHSYRSGNIRKPVEPGAENAKWFEMIGLQSSRHGPRAPIDVIYEETDHPATVGLVDWTTIKSELYNNIKVFDSATVLARGAQTIEGERTDELAIVWTNNYGPENTRIFSLSIGHTSEEMLDENFESLLIRGILWATENINPDGTAKNDLAKL
ncbi:MAG: ThuA domain-containing protein [Verrucomicrobiota bacterium]